MDNNNPLQTPAVPNMAPQTQVPPQPIAPQIPNVPSNGSDSNEQSSSSNKVILWFVVGLIIIVLAVGGVYFFLSRQQAAPAPVETPTTQAPPSPAEAQNLENDLNTVNVDTAGVNSDFSEVDQDLQQL